MLYQIILYLHVAGALGFFLFHGATASATYALKRERGRNSVELLLRTREMSGWGQGISLLTNLISGIVLGFMGRFWGEAWIWISIVTFLAISFVMAGYGRNNLDRIAYMFDPEKYNAPKDRKDEEPIPASEQELAEEQAKGRPVMLTVTGVLALAIILWLMQFKPF